MGGWGEPHSPAPAPVATTGTSREIEEAFSLLHLAGIDEPTLAGGAKRAAEVIDRLRHMLVLGLAADRSSIGEVVSAEVAALLEARSA